MSHFEHDLAGCRLRSAVNGLALKQVRDPQLDGTHDPDPTRTRLRLSN